ncbi:OmpA family protein [Sulfitobacter donghicola]|uniref:Membrane protein n=1 Tax=Sulfitobacter donghicola DSW-25 = KCTC 12864 = JCM 14565 TaxID=1300350 RepID=A0A073IEG3_9RHOB|nr:OmpA family protein [Sulfitobacter donghicola]KEJ88748.1 membrane protein [Sulfitobacter donghicola DSW-25 = KCTC 12864 = JCM 14565]KIN68532.1 OmpA domain protein [Sulfitobacter donghicola DSW-25 = KCTC 12864 = JCM 14565]
MRLSSMLTIFLTFAAAAVVALVAANFSVKLIEDSSEISVRDALDAKGMTWAEVEANGLQVSLSGVAATEAIRFAALTTAGSVVDAARVIDDMGVAAQEALAAPKFSAEVLRNDSGLSVIGLIPSSTDREYVIARFNSLAGANDVTDLLETADYPAPDGWESALDFALTAMSSLPRAKVSVQAQSVSITAITDSAQEKAQLVQDLNRMAPDQISLTLDISAPRPVITPFTTRFQITKDGASFDACSADSEKAAKQITTAAQNAGAINSRCTVGLGVPSPRWADAVTASIDALAKLGGGSVTIADADISLVAAAGTSQSEFDKIVGELENSLPPLFALQSKLPEKQDPNAGPAEFTATLSPEGQVQLRGRVNDIALRELTTSFAKARFGSDKVYSATRVVDDLPLDWATRVLAGLEGLGQLSNGAVTVTPETLVLSGNTGNPDASTEIASLLAGKLGDSTPFDVNVTYQKKLDPVLGLPTPDECEAEVAAIVAAGKINFEPGSATIDSSALGTMDDIATVLKRCGDLRLEIQGYTDSQGREEMNLALSQSRAESVLNELRARRVVTKSFKAVGYGEESPVADNDTEAGREANRRIEFRLVRPKTASTPDETTLETAAENGDTASDTTTEESASE